MKNKLSVLSYNLLNSRAFSELEEKVVEAAPDIVCVQEFNVNQEQILGMENLGYQLADYSYSFWKFFKIYSVATFYNPQTVKHQNGTSIDLVRGFYELMLSLIRVGGDKRTALNNNFTLLANGREFKVCTLHLTALQSTNKVRTNQLRVALNFLDQETTIPSILIGDFNFMYHRKKLEKLLLEFGYQEATSNLRYTLEWHFFFLRLRTKPDYVWYRNLKKLSSERLPRRISDHFPILTEFSF